MHVPSHLVDVMVTDGSSSWSLSSVILFSSPAVCRSLSTVWHLSRIRAHPIYLTIQIIWVQQPYALFRYITNTYSMHTFTHILCIIIHLQNFSDDEMYANWPRTVAPCDGSCVHPCGGAAVRGKLAYISSSEKCCKCVIIHNISVKLCRL